MARAKTVVSAGVVVYVNGKPYGRARSFSFASATPRNAIYALDSTEPFELATSTTKVSGKIGIYRTIGDGGAEGAGIVAPLDELTREKYFSLQLVERVSQTVIFESKTCSVQNQSWSLGEKGVVIGEVDFEAIEWANEVRL